MSNKKTNTEKDNRVNLVNKTGTLRLNKEEKEEFLSLDPAIVEEFGIKTTTDFFKWKLRNAKGAELIQIGSDIKEKNKSLSSIDKMNSSDIVRYTKMEVELEQLRRKNEELNNKSTNGLGEIPLLVEKQVAERMKAMEHEQLKIDKVNLENQIKNHHNELSDLRSKLSVAEEKIRMVNVMKEMAPVLPTLSKALGSGMQGSSNGGGLAGFLAGFGSIESPATTSISSEDKKSLELGQNIYSMFSNEEVEQIIVMISIMGERKDLIQSFMMALHKLSNNENN